MAVGRRTTGRGAGSSRNDPAAGRCLPRVAAGSRPAAGFTLAEVLIALLVLAVGLLALQALGIAAVRGTGLAARNSEAVALAARVMEDARAALARDRLPTSFSCTRPNGDRVSRTATVVGPETLARVDVEVVPEARGPVTAPPLSLHTYAYSAAGFHPSPDPPACP